MQQDTLLKLDGISKQFPGVKALDNVHLEVRRGEVHAIVGENGAGKSTLMKIISGAYKKDCGTIEYDGHTIEHMTPKLSVNSGISVIYQELTYMPTMSIAENIFIGSQPKTGAKLIDYKNMYQRSLEVQKIVGLDGYSPKEEVGHLTAAEKQLLEIARAYVRNLKLLVLDEPTSALNNDEIERLFALINDLKAKGCGIIYITHKMDEIFRIADRVSVLRDGCLVTTMGIADTNREKVITAMVGRELKDMYPISERKIGNVILEAEGLCTDFLKDVSFNVRKGEIVGFYGLMGCGCDLALECIFGKTACKKGEIRMNGQRIAVKKPHDAIVQKIAFAPAERKTEGIMLNQTVRSNISCVTLGKMKKGLLLDLKKEKDVVEKWIQRMRIKTPSQETLALSLSGGNQQKLIIARWLENNPSVFLMNEPTKGIDVGAKAEIYALMEEMCRNGASIIFITSDMPELLAISDRVFVFHEGKVTGEIARAELTQENVIKKAIGE